jgi:hypothetical protein
LPKKGPKKSSTAQIESTSKDATFEEDGESQPSVSLQIN